MMTLVTWRISGLLPCYVVIVLDVVFEGADFDVGKTGRFQELERLLLAPHCAQTHAALCKRGRHAVHARDRVKERPNRVIAVFRNGAGSSNVLHKEDASRFEAAANAGKDVIRARLVMNRVKGRNKIVSSLRGFAMEICEIAHLEAQIPQLRTIRVIACIGDSLLAEVTSREAAVGKILPPRDAARVRVRSRCRGH